MTAAAGKAVQGGYTRLAFRVSMGPLPQSPAPVLALAKATPAS